MITPALVRRAHAAKAEGHTVRSSAPLLGVSHATVQRALSQRPVCRGCGSVLRSPVPGGRCGFCVEESKPEGERL